MILGSTGLTLFICFRHILDMDISSNRLFQNIKHGEDNMKIGTKNNIKIISLILLVFIILYFLHITIGERFEDQYNNEKYRGETHLIFSTDISSKTLTLTEIFAQGRTLYWSDVIITSGSAKLPTGIIAVGDKITNCDGHLELIWEQTGINITEVDFT